MSPLPDQEPLCAMPAKSTGAAKRKAKAKAPQAAALAVVVAAPASAPVPPSADVDDLLKVTQLNA